MGDHPLLRSRTVSDRTWRRVARGLGLSRRGLAFTPSQRAVLDAGTTDVRAALDGVTGRLGEVTSSLEAVASRLDDLGARVGALETPPDPGGAVLEAYVREAPSPQTAVDAFAGEWASAFPPPLEHVRAGGAPLFSAPHVGWGLERLGGVTGQRVLELGPLEGAHTWQLDRAGAREVVAVEANARAFLKCLVTKELLGMPSARFLCGDLERYLEAHLARGGEPFDLVLASGVLYHLQDPVGVLDLLSRVTNRLLLWTHYFDAELIGARPHLAVKFPSSVRREHDGFRYTLHRQEYQGSLDWRGFCGGSAATSAWMPRADVLGALDHVGFEVLQVAFEEEDHLGHGPCLSLVARRRDPLPGVDDGAAAAPASPGATAPVPAGATRGVSPAPAR